MPLLNRPLKAYLLADKGKSLECSKGEKGITIELPAEAPDKIASVIELQLDGKPEPFGYHVGRMPTAPSPSRLLTPISTA